jgi:hypothetical protein
MSCKHLGVLAALLQLPSLPSLLQALVKRWSTVVPSELGGGHAVGFDSTQMLVPVLQAV